MIPIVIGSNILFSAIYNEEGLEREILELSIEKEELQLFAPDIFWEELRRNLAKKLDYSKEVVEELISKFNILEIPQDKYEDFREKARLLIQHEEDVPFIATSLFLNCPIWSGNEKYFKPLENSKEIIWFTSRKLMTYLKEKELITDLKM